MIHQVEERGSWSAASSTRPPPPSPWTAAGAGLGGIPGGLSTGLRFHNALLKLALSQLGIYAGYLNYM